MALDLPPLPDTRLALKINKIDAETASVFDIGLGAHLVPLWAVMETPVTPQPFLKSKKINIESVSIPNSINILA